MPDWRSEYLSSFKDVELSNPVNMELAQTCMGLVPSLPPLACAGPSHSLPRQAADNHKVHKWPTGLLLSRLKRPPSRPVSLHLQELPQNSNPAVMMPWLLSYASIWPRP